MARSPNQPGPDIVQRIGTDPAALDRFYREHVAAVTRLAARRCSMPSEVADVVSATFLTAIDAADGFDPSRGTPRAWLFGIVLHEIASQRRSSNREADKTRRAAAREPLDSDDEQRLMDQIEAERLASPLAAALRAAPEHERDVFTLVAFDELSPTEAAQALGISAVNARVRLMRCRRRLQVAARTTAIPTMKPKEQV